MNEKPAAEGRVMPRMCVRALLCGLFLLIEGWTWGASAQAAPGGMVVRWPYQQSPTSPAERFVVERCEQVAAGCAFAPLAGATIPATQTEWFDATASQPTTNYCYRVFAENSIGRSAPSTGCRVTLGGVPNAPGTLVIEWRPATP